jgi:hypothetical protein
MIMKRKINTYQQQAIAKLLFVFTVTISMAFFQLSAQVRLDFTQGSSSTASYSFSEVKSPVAMPVCQPPENISSNGIPFSPFLPGNRLWGGSYTLIKRGLPNCKVSASGTGNVLIEGSGSNMVKVQWWCHSIANYHCYDPDCNWLAKDTSRLNASVRLKISGVSPGDPVTVTYYWVHFSSIASRSEAMGEDLAAIENASLNLFNQTGFGAGLNMSGDIKFAQRRTGDTTITFTAYNDDTLSIDVTASTIAQVFPPAYLPPNEREDVASADFFGYVLIAVNASGSPVVSLPSQSCPAGITLFSVDIGGDTEISDPSPDGNEILDPGDLYLASATVAIPFFDDFDIFNFDPQPSTGMPAGTCQHGPLQHLQRYLNFDLNGADRIDYDLFSNPGSYGPGLPSIAPFNSNCIFTPEYALISMDEDRGNHFSSAVNCNVPSDFAPEDSMLLRGTPAGQDEVMIALLSNIPGTPKFFGSLMPYKDEQSFSALIAPSPLSQYPPDLNDDVDALDWIPDPTLCDYQYFSVDHEAHYVFGIDTLKPGIIYQHTGQGLYAPVIFPTFHLGLSDDIDIDAFEFTWLWDSVQQRNGLALAFSVSVNDPFDMTDYTGGLDPGVIYASFLNGSYFEMLPAPLPGNIDALTFTCGPLVANGSVYVPPVSWSGYDDMNLFQFDMKLYPNPTAGNFDVIFELPSEATVRIALKDLSGREVWAGKHSNLPGGQNKVSIQTDDVRSGIYFAELQVTSAKNKTAVTRKVIVIK